MSQIFPPTAPVGPINRVITIAEGGTGATTREGALLNLGAIDALKVNQPGGPLLLDDAGKLTLPVSSITLGNAPAVNGPLSVESGVATQFQITNYHAGTTYVITTENGSVTRNQDIITYTAGVLTGVGGFTVNGKAYNIVVGGRSVTRPAITVPVAGATNVGSSLSVVAGAFSVTSGTDIHLSSTWQIAKDNLFATVALQAVDNTTALTTWTATSLEAGTTYYARMRYKGTQLGYSAWSDVVSFVTKANFYPTTEQAKLVASDAASSSRFGWAVSISGDGNTAVVGASNKPPNYRGGAYVFTKVNGGWSQLSLLSTTDSADSDYYGHSVAISSDGNTIIVGAKSKNGTVGAAYVFVHSGDVWYQQAKLLATGATAGDFFGESVAISADGNTSVVGAFGVFTNRGCVYVFTRSGTTWTQQAKLLATGATDGDNVGTSVAMSSDGNTIIVGAPKTTSYVGAAYIFTRSGTTWAQETKLVSATSASNNYFGISVSISSDGNTAVVGEYGKTSYTGAAYIFTRSGTTWTQQSVLTANDGLTSDRFGWAVSISGDGNIVLIGTPDAETIKGKLYIFNRTGTTWTQQAILRSSDGASMDQFGYSVAISSNGSSGIAGSWYKNTSAGAAYIFA